MQTNWRQRIFQPTSPQDFNALALEIFHFQATNNPVYKDYLDKIGRDTAKIKAVEDIPFLPISLFKTHTVFTGNEGAAAVFTSSGTTGSVQSKHYVKSLDLYEASFNTGFEKMFGRAKDWCILALLPSYLEREGSSLIYMADHLIQTSKHPKSGFYLNEFEKLKATLLELEATQQPTLLLGVSFALLDLLDFSSFQLKHTLVMETGGMKGRKEEMIREELHQRLSNGFGVDKIHSEYGMTELLSQAYSKGDGLFECPPWMKVLTRQVNDPLSPQTTGKTGGVNIIDLANIWSCSFIATQDLGRVYADDRFEILGRFDHSDVRGCNLLVMD